MQNEYAIAKDHFADGGKWHLVVHVVEHVVEYLSH